MMAASDSSLIWNHFDDKDADPGTTCYETATEELPLVLSVEGEGPRFAGDVRSPAGIDWVLGDCPTGFPTGSEEASASVSC